MSRTPTSASDVVAHVHLAHGPVERVGRLLRVRDDRREQVREVVVRAELDALRVDEDQPHLVGRVAHEQRRDERVDAARLAGTGRAGDEHVRAGSRGRASPRGPRCRGPRPTSSGCVAAFASGDARMSPSVTSWRALFGTSTPIAPSARGSGARMRTSGDAIAYAMSWLSVVTRFTFTPGRELELVARDRRADRRADEARVDAVLLQRRLEHLVRPPRRGRGRPAWRRRASAGSSAAASSRRGAAAGLRPEIERDLPVALLDRGRDRDRLVDVGERRVVVDEHGGPCRRRPRVDVVEVRRSPVRCASSSMASLAAVGDRRTLAASSTVAARRRISPRSPAPVVAEVTDPAGMRRAPGRRPSARRGRGGVTTSCIGHARREQRAEHRDARQHDRRADRARRRPRAGAPIAAPSTPPASRSASSEPSIGRLSNARWRKPDGRDEDEHEPDADPQRRRARA